MTNEKACMALYVVGIVGVVEKGRYLRVYNASNMYSLPRIGIRHIILNHQGEWMYISYSYYSKNIFESLNLSFILIGHLICTI